jgi:Tol biopolymer transport system component
MIADDRFERLISDWLHVDAEHRVPDHLDAVLRLTRSERQRPAWSSLERWLSMDTTFTGRLAPAMRPAWPILIAIMILIALAAVMLVAGSRQPLPAPFGPALSGVTARAESGDIFLRDPATGRQTVIAGPEWDSLPGFSPDGTKLSFLRSLTADAMDATIMVANTDGTDLRPVTDPILDMSSGGWSGDGAWIALSARDTTTTASDDYHLLVVDVARGTTAVLDVGMSVSDVSWLPPDGREIVFRGQTALPSALWAIRPDGTGLRPLTARDGAPDTGYQEPVLSPDGRLLAYVSWDDNWALVVHVQELASERAWTIPTSERLADLGAPIFSPDGRYLLVRRHVRDAPPPVFDGVARLMLVPVDGSDEGRPIGHEFPFVESQFPDFHATFSVDGATVLMVDRASDVLWTLPVDGAPGTSEPWPSDDLPGTQRLPWTDGAPAPCPGGGCPR